MSTKIDERHLRNTFFASVYFFAVALIFPFNIRNITVFLLLFVTAISFFYPQKGNIQSLNKAVFFNTIFSVFLLTSLIYTENVDYGLKRMMAMTGLFIFPIAFFQVNTRIDINYSKLSERLYMLFFISCIIFFVGIFIQNYFKGFLNEFIFRDYPERLNSKYGKYSMHPVYASMYIVISLFFATKIYNTLKKRWHKIIFYACVFFLAFVLILLARKGVILFALLTFSVYFLKLKKKKETAYFTATSIVLFAIIIIIPPIRGRYVELVDSIVNYNNITKIGSTTIRFNIFKLVSKAISDNVMLGYGIGDTKDVLIAYYKAKPEIFDGQYYNSHNQFLSSWLTAGLLGITSFIAMLVYNLKLAIKSCDFVYGAIVLMFLFVCLTENILERQSGVLLFSFLINFFAFKTLVKFKNK